MKKRMVFLAMLVCVLAFGLVFVGCKSDDGGGGAPAIPKLTPFTVAALSEIDLDVSGGTAVPLASAETVITPIFKLLCYRYWDLSNFIEDEVIGEDSGSINKDLSDYQDDSELTGVGIENLAGSAKGSATESGASFSGSAAINLTHDYYSASDSAKGSFTGTVEAKVKGAANITYGDNPNSESYGEAVNLSYAVAFISGGYSGYAIVTASWAWAGVYIIATDEEKFTSRPVATIKFDVYDPDGSFIGTKSYTGAAAVDMLGLNEGF